MPSTHIGEDGTAHMVDVGTKPIVARVATASGRILLNEQAMHLVTKSHTSKGPVVAVATVAAISAAKRTAELIPLCHNLPLDKVDVEFAANAQNTELICTATVATRARTGVEMEALTAVHIGLLTVYDMCKSADRQMEITSIRLVSKSKATEV